jgi:uncharacterized protein (DUF2141 family)
MILLSVLALATCTGHLVAQTQSASTLGSSTLTVQVTGIRNAKGKIRATLYRDTKFVENRDAEVDAKSLTAKVVFDNIPQGVYTVNLFHDENMNGKMDTNFFGVPVEGYGMSNNPKKRMSKPGFDETNFPVNRPECVIEIKMIYW